MIWYTVRRLVSAVPILVLVSFLTFLLLHIAPGDPAQAVAGPRATPEELAATRERLGLNDSLATQYSRWVGGLLQGNFGESLVTGQPVLDEILRRLPVTLSLTAGAMVVALLVALPGGILAALRRGGWTDRLVIAATSLGIALPDFFVGLLLILVFALGLDLLPALGYAPLSGGMGAWLAFLVLPSVALGTAVAAELARQVRAGLNDTLGQDFIRTARAAGAPTPLVVTKHALRNAAIPVVTVLGLQIRRLLGGTIAVEQIFDIPGIGSLIIDSVFQRDIPMVLGIAVISALLVVVINLVVDLSYGLLNPRVRT